MLLAENHSTLRLVIRALTARDRIRLSIALILILIGSLLEMASLGLVIPVVQSVLSGDLRSRYTWLPSVLENLSYRQFVQVLMLGLVAMFLFKNAFIVASNYYQQRVQLSIMNRLVHKLFETYLRQPYEFHLQNSTSLLVRNVQEFSSGVVGSGVSSLLVLATEFVSAFGLLTVLVLVQPWATIVMLVLFGLVAALMVGLSRLRTRRWGTEILHLRGVWIQTLLAGFGGVKEIKVFGRDAEILSDHQRSLQQAGKSTYMFSLLQGIPRGLFEVTLVVGVALLVALTLRNDRDPKDAVLVIALFGIAAFRVLPSVNKVVQAIQKLSFGRSSIEGAIAGLSLSTPVRISTETGNSDSFGTLQIAEVRYCYPGTETPALTIDVFTVNAGESLGIVGASGSGKSTLVDLLIGILTPVEGSILINGRNLVDDPRYWQNRIGYVPQHVFLMDTTIRKNVAFGLAEKVIDDRAVNDALRAANLLEFVTSLPDGVNTVVGERGVRLSGGQRQRLGIARALYGNPEVIVLDEATSALDEDTEREIVEAMREISRDRTLIVVAHRTSTLAHCSRLIRLEAGRIVQEGSFEEVIGSLPNA